MQRDTYNHISTLCIDFPPEKESSAENRWEYFNRSKPLLNLNFNCGFFINKMFKQYSELIYINVWYFSMKKFTKMYITKDCMVYYAKNGCKEQC